MDGLASRGACTKGLIILNFFYCIYYYFFVKFYSTLIMLLSKFTVPYFFCLSTQLIFVCGNLQSRSVLRFTLCSGLTMRTFVGNSALVQCTLYRQTQHPTEFRRHHPRSGWSQLTQTGFICIYCDYTQMALLAVHSGDDF